MFTQLPDTRMVDGIISLIDQFYFPFRYSLYSFFLGDHHTKHVFPNSPGCMHLPVFRQLQMHLEAKDL